MFGNRENDCHLFTSHPFASLVGNFELLTVDSVLKLACHLEASLLNQDFTLNRLISFMALISSNWPNKVTVDRARRAHRIATRSAGDHQR